MKTSLIITHENVLWHSWLKIWVQFRALVSAIFNFLVLKTLDISFFETWLAMETSSKQKRNFFIFQTHLSRVFKYLLTNVTLKTRSLLCVESRKKNICLYVCDGAWQNEAKCCICMATANTFVWSLAWWPLAMCVFRLLGQKNTIIPWVNPYN